MSRRSKPERRIPSADPIYNSVDVSKFINRVMRRGKKSIAEKIFYSTITKVEERTNEKGLEIFQKALTNATPLLEVKARRIGGATYQVPIEVRSERRQTLALRWITLYSRKRGEKTQEERLANEIMDAANNTGASVKKKEDMHKMAEANKAFAHYRF